MTADEACQTRHLRGVGIAFRPAAEPRKPIIEPVQALLSERSIGSGIIHTLLHFLAAASSIPRCTSSCCFTQSPAQCSERLVLILPVEVPHTSFHRRPGSRSADPRRKLLQDGIARPRRPSCGSASAPSARPTRSERRFVAPSCLARPHSLARSSVFILLRSRVFAPHTPGTFHPIQSYRRRRNWSLIACRAIAPEMRPERFGPLARLKARGHSTHAHPPISASVGVHSGSAYTICTLSATWLICEGSLTCKVAASTMQRWPPPGTARIADLRMPAARASQQTIGSPPDLGGRSSKLARFLQRICRCAG